MRLRSGIRAGLLLFLAAGVASAVLWLRQESRPRRLVVAAYAFTFEFLHLSRLGIVECLARTGFSFEPAEPELAESWTHDGQGTWVVGLRPGVRFHDGSALTAAAAAASVERHLASPDGEHLRGRLRVEVRDEATLVLRASSPTLPVPDHLGRVPILAPGSFGPDGRLRWPVGTGPYALERAAPDEGASLTAHRRWWRGAPAVDGVDLRVVKDPATRVLLLESGEADWIQMVPRHDAERLARAGFQVRESRYLYNVYLLFQCASGVGSDPMVRRAAALAIDRARVARLAFAGGADPAEGIFPPGHPLGPPADRASPPPPDPAAAEARLDAAGWVRPASGATRARRGEELVLPLLTVAEAYRPAWTAAAELVRQDLARVGIRAEVQVLERGAWTSRVDRGEFVATLRGRVPGWLPDPAALLRTDFHSAGTNNACRFRDPAFDRAVEEAWSAAGPAAREEALRAAVRLLAEQVPVVPLCHDRGRETFAAAPGVAGVDDDFSLRNAFPSPGVGR